MARGLPSFNCCHDLAGGKKGLKRLAWRDRWTVMLRAGVPTLPLLLNKILLHRPLHNEPWFSWKYIFSGSHPHAGQRREPNSGQHPHLKRKIILSLAVCSVSLLVKRGIFDSLGTGGHVESLSLPIQILISISASRFVAYRHVQDMRIDLPHPFSVSFSLFPSKLPEVFKNLDLSE